MGRVIHHLKAGYVGGFRLARRCASRLGLLAALESRREKRWCVYLRSLFSIYDVADLLALDLPWWSYAAIDRVEAFLLKCARKASVFEYGAGASTAWLARRAGRVISVEHDREFAASVIELLKDFGNVSLWCRAPGKANPGDTHFASSRRRGYEGFDFSEYVRAIEEAHGPFDVIVIDGRARAACLSVAVHHLTNGGIIVFDNSNRSEYAAALGACRLARETYRDWAPALPFKSETSILYREARPSPDPEVV